MKLDFPRSTERVGAINIHAVQRIYELDSGKSKGFQASNQTIKALSYEEISNILNDLAIVIPVKSEKLKLLEGVLSGIPNECLVIIVSNSPRSPVDRFAMEVEMVRQLSPFTGKRVVIIHQKDSGLADAFKKVEYASILDRQGNIRDGKAEGMLIGMLLAKMYHRDYVGFIDADNYIPGAVNEYVKIFAAGFGMAATPFSMVRISWVYKPKIKSNSLHFSKWGRVSEITNKILNSLLSQITGFETEVIKTGNAGEHALSMDLADRLNYASGYGIEPYEFIDSFEKFGGIRPSLYPEVMEKGVEIFQIETRNPHLHEDRGIQHITEMLRASLYSVLNSVICPTELKHTILKHIHDDLLEGKKESAGRNQRRNAQLTSDKKRCVMEPIISIKIQDFAKLVKENANTFHKYGSI